jgi:Uma2 family endonuclease
LKLSGEALTLSNETLKLPHETLKRSPNPITQALKSIATQTVRSPAVSELTLADLEKIQLQFPEHRMELVNGEVIIMSPSGYESDEVALEAGRQLANWVRPRNLGRVTGSSAGFILPNSDTRAPDVSFVLADRLRRSPRRFAELAPDLMVEVKSPTDRLSALREKIDEFLSLGTTVGILINPEERWIEVRRAGLDPETLHDGDILTVPDLLPGWEVEVASIWAVEFD